MARFTQQQLDDLRAALATGALSVDTPNMRTTFRSLDDMLKLESQMSADIGGSTSVPSRVSLGSYSKD